MKWLLVLIFLLSNVSAKALFPGADHLIFRYQNGYSDFSFPIKPNSKYTQSNLNRDINLRRELGWKIFSWLTEEENGLARIFHFMNLNEVEFGLNSTDSSYQRGPNFIEMMNIESLLYPTLSLWDEQKYYVWSRQELRAEKIGQKSMPRLGFDSRYLNFLSTKRKIIGKCFSGNYPTINCFNNEEMQIPFGTTVVKFEWRELQSNKVELAQTSSEQIISMLETTKTWNLVKSDHSETPKMITAKKENGKVFFLAGFHVMSKIYKDWFWATYWLDPNENDFNNDKDNSSTIDEWKPYSMCSVSDYKEEDFNNKRSKYAVANNNFQWCSNPYLESHKKMAATNCIGCHQHAGKLPTAKSVIEKKDQGQNKESEIFENDYLWSFTQFPAEIGYKLRD
jgi:hypothetical protein